MYPDPAFYHKCETGDPKQYVYMLNRIEAFKQKSQIFTFLLAFSWFMYFLSKKVR